MQKVTELIRGEAGTESNISVSKACSFSLHVLLPAYITVISKQ